MPTTHMDDLNSWGQAGRNTRPPIGRMLLLLGLFNTNVNAQDLYGIDSVAWATPIQSTPFAGIRGAGSDHPSEFTIGLRSSYRTEPLSLRIPTPSASGLDASAVSGVLSAELVAGLYLGYGWDVGVNLGAHVYQWGSGTGSATGDDNQLPSFGARDPRLEVGWAWGTDLFRIRPFLMAIFPFGSANAFAGERSMRMEGGASFSGSYEFLHWGAELNLHLRETAQLSATTWGTQLHLGVGVMVELTPQLFLGPELHLQPLLVSQPLSDAQIFPAELLLTAHYRFSYWSLGMSGGTGLPLSESSSVNSAAAAVRGPTSSLFVALLDLRFAY